MDEVIYPLNKGDWVSHPQNKDELSVVIDVADNNKRIKVAPIGNQARVSHWIYAKGWKVAVMSRVVEIKSAMMLARFGQREEDDLVSELRRACPHTLPDGKTAIKNVKPQCNTLSHLDECVICSVCRIHWHQVKKKA